MTIGGVGHKSLFVMAILTVVIIAVVFRIAPARKLVTGS